MTPQRYTAWIS